MTSKIIVDAEGAVYGRLCSYVAKQALEGKEVAVVNSEKSVITGNKKDILGKYQQRKARGGHSQRGPKFSRESHLILKRAIRGMIPNFREGFGRETYFRIKCYNGIPKEFEGQKMIKIPGPSKNKFVKMSEVTESLN